VRTLTLAVADASSGGAIVTSAPQTRHHPRVNPLGRLAAYATSSTSIVISVRFVITPSSGLARNQLPMRWPLTKMWHPTFPQWFPQTPWRLITGRNKNLWIILGNFSNSSPLPMSKQINHIYEFGEFRLETAEQLLLRQGEPTRLTRKEFDTLLVLVQSSGHLVEKDELMKRVWADTFVEEANLARNVWSLRKVLSDDQGEHRYIETVPKRGYRFIAPVRDLAGEDTEVLFQRRVRAHIVCEEEETSEEPQPQPKVTMPTQPLEKTRSLSETAVLTRKRLTVAVLAIAGLIVATAIGTMLIRNARSTGSTKTIESVAILPFNNLSNDPELDYLSEGITESLINRLSQVSRLKIIAHNSVYRYKGKQVDAQKVGGELGVQAVLIGKLEAKGSDLSISGELVDARDGSHLWGEHYDRRINDIQSLQRELAQDMATALRLQFSGDEKTRLTRHSTQDDGAYQLYLKGRYFWNKRTREGIQKGLDCFEQAIHLDPNYAAAYVGLADCYSVLSQSGEFSPNEVMPKAKVAAFEALRIDDSLAEAHASLAVIYELYDWNWREAETEFRRAIELNPNYATAHHWYAMYLSAHGRRDEAVAEIRKAETLDPVSLITNTNEGWILFCAREYDQAIQKLRATIEMDPNFANAHYKLGLVYEIKGMFKEAAEEYIKNEALSGTKTEAVDKLRAAYTASGWRGFCLEKLRQLNDSSARGYVLPKHFVLTQLQLGDREQTFRWLEEAYKERAEPMVYLRVDPRLDPLRSDPRFEGLLRRVNLAS
jgi:TolB-like protein/DNA-binding winged helix-turn-helix (wHTH) protein